MARVSVVIPAYNVADYLDECLGSLIVQDFEDWEAICVDDGSTDDTRILLEHWAAHDARVKTVSIPNGGVSHARNVAMARATGEVVCFLDADDRLQPQALSRIVRAFDETQADVVTFGATCFPQELSSAWLDANLSPRDVVYRGFKPALAFLENAQPFIGRAALTRSFGVRAQATFDETLSVGEDTAWFLHAYPRADTVALVSDHLYEYRIKREGSAVTSEDKGSLRRLGQHVDVVERVFVDWEEGGFLDRWGDALAAWAISYCGYAVLRAPSPDRDALVRRLGDVFERHLTDARMSRQTPRPDVMAMVGLFETSTQNGQLTVAPWKVRAACLLWRLREYGLRDLIETVLGRGGSRSGSRG